jgi:hypothetical protein
LLEREFEALLAMNWGPPPTVRALHPDTTDPAMSRSRPVWASDRQLPSRPRHPGSGGWGRSRSPPDR